MPDAATADPAGAGTRPVWWFLVLALVIVVADQITKWLIVAGLFGLPFGGASLFTLARPSPGEVTGFFNLVLVGNTGVSFGLFRGGGARWFLVVLSLAIVVALLVWLWRAPGAMIRVARS